MGADLTIIPKQVKTDPFYSTLNTNEQAEVYIRALSTESTSWFSRLFKPSPLKQQLKKWQEDHSKDSIEQNISQSNAEIVIKEAENLKTLLENLFQVLSEGSTTWEVFLVKRHISGDNEGTPCINPSAPKVKHYSVDDKGWWKASFDFKQIAPVTEDPELFSMIQTNYGMLNEVRGEPLWSPHVRIVYGTDEIKVLEPDKQTKRFEDELARQIKIQFGENAPEFLNNKGESGKVIRITKDGKIGYSFLIRRVDESLIALYGNSARMREYELFTAFENAINQLQLAPVIMWTRNSNYIFNLWER